MKFTTLIIIAAVLVVGLGAVFLLLHKNVAPAKQAANINTNATASANPQVVYAHPGDLIPSFPKDLLIGANQETQSSFAVTYPNTTQSTVVFDSSENADVLYNAYLVYLQSNKYELLNHQDAKGSASIYAINGSGDVSLDMSTDGKFTKVKVSYLKK